LQGKRRKERTSMGGGEEKKSTFYSAEKKDPRRKGNKINLRKEVGVYTNRKSGLSKNCNREKTHRGGEEIPRERKLGLV